MSVISIRPISTADIDSFSDALRSVISERQYLAASTPPLPKQISDFVTRNIELGYPQLVATDNDVVIGWCDAVAQSPEERAHVARMGMGVLADFRSKGIGRKLISQCIDLATEFGFEKVELEVYSDNDRALSLYTGHGFHIEGTRKKSRKLDGRYQDIIMMCKFLTDLQEGVDQANQR